MICVWYPKCWEKQQNRMVYLKGASSHWTLSVTEKVCDPKGCIWFSLHRRVFLGQILMCVGYIDIIEFIDV